jgi:putative ABC transport system substrate-binding protein
MIRRREFITLLGGAAAAPCLWALAARAQQAKAPPVVIGLLYAGDSVTPDRLAAFRLGLAEWGFVDGRDVAIELRATADYARLPALAAELVGRRVAVIYTISLPATLAAKAAAATIPIVFSVGADPVEFGLVASLNKPGGSVTGISSLLGELLPKRLELLRELVPAADVIGVLVDPNNPNSEARSKDAREAARKVRQDISLVGVGSERDLDAAFARLVENRARALLVADDPLFSSHFERIIALASRYSLPASYPFRLHAEKGGLMSYGTSTKEIERQAGIYVGRILKGDKPADLPVMQPTKFELVINLRTAKALGLTIPLTLQYAADEVIE